MNKKNFIYVGCILVPLLILSYYWLRTWPITIDFSLNYQQQPINCHTLSHLDPHQLNDFRLYLHDIELQDQDHNWHKIHLQPSPWQNHRIVLLDFKNNQEPCKTISNATNQSIIATSPIKNFQRIKFTLGVPFELNHQNPLTAQAPLNHASMHWHWQSGYKFIRAEFTINGISHRLHLGSLHCQGEVNHITHCNTPNRKTYYLDINPQQPQINITLDQLLNARTEERHLTCMGMTEAAWCATGLAWLGLENDQAATLFTTTPSAPHHQQDKH